MRFLAITSLSLVAFSGVESFSTSSQVRAPLTVCYGYVPQGFTEESYKKFKENEAKKKAQSNLGKLGPRGFQSRSMQSFQEALERGEAAHLMPMFNAADKLKRGEIKKEDIPYMQRGGSWDNADVKGAKRKSWLKSDKQYSAGGYKKEQSVSIFGYGEGLDWAGNKARRGPSESIPGAAPKFARNYKAPNVNSFKSDNGGEKKKKFFGLF